PGAVNVEGSKAAGFHGRGGIGRMRLYDAHLVKLDLSKLTRVTFPGVIYRTKTKRHAPQVATFSQGQQITASLRIGYSEREIKPIVVFPQFQRVRLSAPQQHGGVVVAQTENVTARRQRLPERTGPDHLSKVGNPGLGDTSRGIPHQMAVSHRQGSSGGSFQRRHG